MQINDKAWEGKSINGVPVDFGKVAYDPLYNIDIGTQIWDYYHSRAVQYFNQNSIPLDDTKLAIETAFLYNTDGRVKVVEIGPDGKPQTRIEEIHYYDTNGQERTNWDYLPEKFQSKPKNGKKHAEEYKKNLEATPWNTVPPSAPGCEGGC